MNSRTFLETDFNALGHNIAMYKSFLKPTTKMMAVVKAAGYGPGAVKIAQYFENCGLDYFAVAFTEEGIELRDAGITLPIIVFNPELEYFNKLLKYDLEPVIYDFGQFEKFASFNDSNFKIHLKLDSGMKRLGFSVSEIEKLNDTIAEFKNIKVVSIYSHLAASEELEKDNFTYNQIDVFSQMYHKIQSKLNYKPLKHILNSSGIVRFSSSQFDMVRLGIGMHSDDTSNTINNKLKAVHTLRTKISQIKTIKAGEGIGYGRKCIKKYNRKIAIIPIGYADGLIRLAGNSNYKVWIKDQFAPIVANISMDSCFIDITDLKNVKTGDSVEVFGKHAKIQDLAKAANTISYELFTRISSRVQRVYVE